MFIAGYMLGIATVAFYLIGEVFWEEHQKKKRERRGLAKDDGE